MDPITILALAAARLIASHGDGLLDAGGDLAKKLVDKGTKALAGSAVAGLVGWLRTRVGDKHGEFETSARAAVAEGDDARIDELARLIEAAAKGAK